MRRKAVAKENSRVEVKLIMVTLTQHRTTSSDKFVTD